MSDKRDEILEVARAMFAEQGLGATTVRQIGRRAGMLSGSLYHHFGSKQDIVDAVLQDFRADVMGRYRQIDRSPLDPVTKARALVAHGFSTIVDHRAAVMIIQSDLDELRSVERFSYLDEMTREIEGIWVEVVTQGVRAGVFRSTPSPHLFFRIVFDAVYHAVRWFDPEGPLAIEYVADQVGDFLIGGLVVPGAEAAAAVAGRGEIDRDRVGGF